LPRLRGRGRRRPRAGARARPAYRRRPRRGALGPLARRAPGGARRRGAQRRRAGRRPGRDGGAGRAGSAMNLTEACIRKPVFAWMLMAGTVLFGLVAIGRIGISQMPDVDFPTINVSVAWEGAAPEVIENDVIQALEEALIQVEGVKSLTS